MSASRGGGCEDEHYGLFLVRVTVLPAGAALRELAKGVIYDKQPFCCKGSCEKGYSRGNISETRDLVQAAEGTDTSRFMGPSGPTADQGSAGGASLPAPGR